MHREKRLGGVAPALGALDLIAKNSSELAVSLTLIRDGISIFRLLFPCPTPRQWFFPRQLPSHCTHLG